MSNPASDEQIQTWLGDHGAWSYDAERKVLERIFKFADFVEAFGFMTVVAIRAQALNHHPDWSNSYDTVDVELTTHDADAVTENDFELAAFMDDWAAKHGAKASE